jgi:hypothetical protein
MQPLQRQWGGRGTGAGFNRLRTAGSGNRYRAWWSEVWVQLAQYAKRKFPSLNVVMVSGHGPPYVPHGTHFLQKPYLPQQLLDAVLK